MRSTLLVQRKRNPSFGERKLRVTCKCLFGVAPPLFCPPLPRKAHVLANRADVRLTKRKKNSHGSLTYSSCALMSKWRGARRKGEERDKTALFALQATVKHVLNNDTQQNNDTGSNHTWLHPKENWVSSQQR